MITVNDSMIRNKNINYSIGVKMKKILLILTTVFILSPAGSYAADYYFCECSSGADANCEAGSDQADGATPATAKQSYSAANAAFNAAEAGSTIHFCRGGSFNTSAGLQWLNYNSDAANPVTVKDYAPTTAPLNDARPIIRYSGTGYLFNFADGGSAAHEEGYVFANLDLKCIGCTADNSTVGFFLYRDVDFVTIDNVSIDGFRIGVQGADDLQANCTVRNSQIQNSLSQGFLGGCENGLIENTTFINNGGFSNREHNLYWSRGNNAVIQGNTLYQSATGDGDMCSGASLVVHTHSYPMDNLRIENNYVYEDIGQANSQCYGISVSPGYAVAELFTNVVVRGNTVKNVGNVSINVSSCHDCIVENNVVVHEQPGHRNIAIASATPPLEGDATNTRMIYRNNSIYISSNRPGSRGLDVRYGNGNVIVSNAVYYTGNSANWGCFAFSGSVTDTTVFNAVDNNICEYPNSGGEWVTDFGGLAEWQTASIFDQNSKNVSPGFTEPASPANNFSLVINSEAIGSGHLTESAENDTRNKKRDAQPDVGAYEFGSFNPPAATTLYFGSKSF